MVTIELHNYPEKKEIREISAEYTSHREQFFINPSEKYLLSVTKRIKRENLYSD